ncbi:MAG: multicopper oxidase domain-containing protein [Oscillatoria sp. SIO1A7]|nr:multicopper oxidase domain-containing protein [Oscillatoria sp. SIO1A7]
MKQNNGVADRSGWLCWRRWLKIALCTFAIAAMAIGGGSNQSALAQNVNPLSYANRNEVNTSDWYDPPKFQSQDGELNVTLTVGERNYQAFAGTSNLVLRSYKGECNGNCSGSDDVEGAVGPTLRVKAGDVLKVHLVNNLTELDHANCEDGATHENKLHCFDYTNLHTHGLHISPEGNSDNVLVNIPPRESHKFELQIPGKAHNLQDHYPGTFWYHAHRHGSTTVQLASGMAGALIVEDPADVPKSITDARERIFVFQQLAFDARGKVQERDNNMVETLFDNFNGKGDEAGPRKYTTINGRQVPVINMQPAEVERWRFIDAGIFELLDIKLLDDSNKQEVADFFYTIALDGIYLKNVRKVKDIKMAPGYRVDAMVKAPAAGTYWLFKKRTTFLPSANTPPNPREQILAKVVVAGKDCEGNCHSDLPTNDDLNDLPRPKDLMNVSTTVSDEEVEFSFGDNSDQFLINDKQYDPKTVQFCLQKDAVQDWKLTSMAGQHPFHIHVNAFQIIDPGNSQDLNKGDWRDTIVVPAKSVGNGKPIIIRTKYENFTGHFVLHCHILHHEDQGMMSLVQIKDANTCAPPNGS